MEIFFDVDNSLLTMYYGLLSTVGGCSMQTYELNQLIAQRAASNKAYLEFLKAPDLSMGLYVLPADGVDPQSPHTEDEVYYVISGKAMVKVADEDHAVQAGSIIFVAKNVEHRFYSIEEELTVLAFFAPAEYSRKEIK
jgi:mannose-6-phosphate isomerase-like protein (cupin superfamily)